MVHANEFCSEVQQSASPRIPLVIAREASQCALLISQPDFCPGWGGRRGGVEGESIKKRGSFARASQVSVSFYLLLPLLFIFLLLFPGTTHGTPMTASDCRQRSRKRGKKRVQTICFENKRGKGRGEETQKMRYAWNLIQKLNFRSMPAWLVLYMNQP